ncbi:hypothetical protein C1646_764952 [Rhizophagus diaphanus]|nr:hypothetical protein C1646_764952 [Rhizophagus diaphanus] [Rhizophagus sp. MUCL 43196]
MSQQSAIVQVDHNSLDNSTNFIEIQEMHIRKSDRSREILPPKTTQNFKPVFLSNIFTKALKEDQERQAKAEVSNMESSKDI